MRLWWSRECMALTSLMKSSRPSSCSNRSVFRHFTATLSYSTGRNTMYYIYYPYPLIMTSVTYFQFFLPLFQTGPAILHVSPLRKSRLPVSRRAWCLCHWWGRWDWLACCLVELRMGRSCGTTLGSGNQSQAASRWTPAGPSTETTAEGDSTCLCLKDALAPNSVKHVIHMPGRHLWLSIWSSDAQTALKSSTNYFRLDKVKE